MAKKSPEEKAAEDALRDEANRKKGKHAAGEKVVTIEDALNGIEEQFGEYIKNVGFSVLDMIAREIRKLAKEGINDDKVEGTIVLRVFKEGLKLTLNAKSVVVVKDVQRDEFTSLTSDPSNPVLPGMEAAVKPEKPGKAETPAEAKPAEPDAKGKEPAQGTTTEGDGKK